MKECCTSIPQSTKSLLDLQGKMHLPAFVTLTGGHGQEIWPPLKKYKISSVGKDISPSSPPPNTASSRETVNVENEDKKRRTE